jgi:HK97 family phage prohead protease
MTKQMVMENKSVIREAVLRALTDEQKKNRTAEFVISTEAVDTYGTVFKSSGWDLTRYQKNPIVAYGHRTWSDNPDMIIGTSEVRIEDGQLIGKVTFEAEDVNPTAETIWRKVQAGTLRMASVGANVLEWRWGDTTLGEDKENIYFTRIELLEWSIVPIGSNPDAHVREAKTIEEIRAALAVQNTPAPIENPGAETTNLSVRERQFKFNSNKSF